MPRSRCVLLSCALIVAGATRAADAPKDFTKVTPSSLGIKLLTPTKDEKTGFVVGGKNTTDLILGLKELAKLPIAKLEKAMRPKSLSTAGFLGKDEKLLDILAEDNRFVVEKHGLTHQELARHLHVLGALAVRDGADRPVRIVYHGRRFELSAKCYRGFQVSPFEDGTKTNCDVKVENVATEKVLSYSLLVPFMIERYGFYEGKGTPYRVDPAKVLEVLDFVKPAKAK